MNKIEKFSWNGIDYEIRALPIEGYWRAAVFHGGSRTGPIFSVSQEDEMDCVFYAGERGLDTLFKMIKDQIRLGQVTVQS